MSNKHRISLGPTVAQQDRAMKRLLIKPIRVGAKRSADAKEDNLEIARLRTALERLRLTALLLWQNSEGCALNHYGADFERYGLPGWLADAKADIEAAAAMMVPKQLAPMSREDRDLLHGALAFPENRREQLTQRLILALAHAASCPWNFSQRAYERCDRCAENMEIIKLFKELVP